MGAGIWLHLWRRFEEVQKDDEVLQRVAKAEGHQDQRPKGDRVYCTVFTAEKVVPKYPKPMPNPTSKPMPVSTGVISGVENDVCV